MEKGESSTKETVLSSAFWRLSERVCANMITFVVSVILARVLSANEYGLIGLVLVITTVLQVIADSGFGKSLIQKKDASDVDFTTVFIFNVIFSIVIYSLLFLLAPLMQRFMGYADLAIIIRVSGTIIIIASLKNVIQSYIMKNMQFKLFFWGTLGGTVISGIVSIIMAINGFGVWALVAQQIINPLLDTAILWIITGWHPRLVFSFSTLKSLFSFSSRLLLSDLLNEIFNGVRTVVIGKFYTPADLGFYENGRKLPTSIYTNVDSSLRSVIFPVLAREQDNQVKVKEYMLRMINTCYYVTTPILFGLAACSKNIIDVLYTDKWSSAVPYMQITCFIWFFNSIQAINQQVILSQGRSDICLKIEVINKALTIIALVISIRIGVFAVAISQLFVTFLGVFINLFPNIKLIDCRMCEQIRCCSKEVAVNLAMGMIVYCIGFLDISSFWNLVLQVFVGVIFYLIVSATLKLEGYAIVRNFLLSKLSKNK